MANHRIYYDVYKGLVDPNRTSDSTIKANRIEYKNTDTNPGKVELTIPVRKDESVWLRLCPKQESGGHYAVMRNLKMNFITN